MSLGSNLFESGQATVKNRDFFRDVIFLRNGTGLFFVMKVPLRKSLRHMLPLRKSLRYAAILTNNRDTKTKIRVAGNSFPKIRIV